MIRSLYTGAKEIRCLRVILIFGILFHISCKTNAKSSSSAKSLDTVEMIDEALNSACSFGSRSQRDEDDSFFLKKKTADEEDGNGNQDDGKVRKSRRSDVDSSEDEDDSSVADAKSENREISDSVSIEILGAMRLKWVKGSSPKATVTGRESTIEHVAIEKQGSTICIYYSSILGFRKSPTITITTSNLEKLSASGASKVEIKDQDLGSLDMKISGASEVFLESVALESLDAEILGASVVKGSARDDSAIKSLKLNLSGASFAKLSKLPAEKIWVDVKGASQADVHAIDSIEGNASGASSIHYYGSPNKKALEHDIVSLIKHRKDVED